MNQQERTQLKMLHDWAHKPKVCNEHIDSVEWMLKLLPCDNVEDLTDINTTRRVLERLREIL